MDRLVVDTLIADAHSRNRALVIECKSDEFAAKRVMDLFSESQDDLDDATVDLSKVLVGTRSIDVRKLFDRDRHSAAVDAFVKAQRIAITSELIYNGLLDAASVHATPVLDAHRATMRNASVARAYAQQLAYEQSKETTFADAVGPSDSDTPGGYQWETVSAPELRSLKNVQDADQLHSLLSQAKLINASCEDQTGHADPVHAQKALLKTMEGSVRDGLQKKPSITMLLLPVPIAFVCDALNSNAGTLASAVTTQSHCAPFLIACVDDQGHVMDIHSISSASRSSRWKTTPPAIGKCFFCTMSANRCLSEFLNADEVEFSLHSRTLSVY